MGEKLSTPEKNDNASEIPRALQIEEIDKLRAEQTRRENRAVIDSPFDDLVAQEQKRMEAREGFKDVIVEYLKERGIDENHEKFKEYKDFLRDHSIDNIPSALWDAGSQDDNSPMSQRLKTSREVAQRFSPKASNETTSLIATAPSITSTAEVLLPASASATPETSVETKTAAEQLKTIDDLEGELRDKREARHAAFAARMAVATLRFMKKRKLNKRFQEAEALYHQSLEKLEQLRYQAHTEGGVTDEEFGQALEERLNKRFIEDKEAQRKVLVEKGGLKAKALEWWANLSPAKKIAYGMVGGAAIAGSGFAIGLAATAVGGVVGSALAMGGGAGLAATKSARGWAMVQSGIYAKDTERLKVEHKNGATSAERLQDILGAMRRQTEEKIKQADIRKAAAVLVGVGSAALGAATAINLLDRVSGTPAFYGGWVGEAIADQGASPEVSSVTQEAPKWNIEPAPKTPEVANLGPDAAKIFAGDGGYDIFNRIPAIQQENWPELWNKVGPELANVKMSNGMPFGYQMPNGEWGVRMPPLGEGVPKEALEIIANKHQELFGTNPMLPNGGVAEVVSEAKPLPPTLDHSPLTETDVEVLKEAVKEGGINGNVSLDTISITNHPEVFDKLSYVSRGLDLHTYATEALSLPDRWAEDVEKYVAEQLTRGEPAFTSVFETVNGDIRFRGGKLPPDVLAKLFNSVPLPVREQFVLAG